MKLLKMTAKKVVRMR